MARTNEEYDITGDVFLSSQLDVLNNSFILFSEIY